MSYFKNATVTGSDLYAAAKETCARLYVLLGGSTDAVWSVLPYPGTAAIEVKRWGAVPHITLCMPAIALDARLTRGEADTLMAFVTHELGHALYTDFAHWEDAKRKGVASLTNALEDYRIEHKLCTVGNRLPMARELLTGLTEYMILQAKTTGWNVLDPQSLAFTLGTFALTHRSGLLYAAPSAPDWDATLPAPMLAFFLDVMKRLKACTSTADCVALAVWIKGAVAQMHQTAKQAQAGQGASKPGAGAGNGQPGTTGQSGAKGTGQSDTQADDASDAGTGKGDKPGDADADDADMDDDDSAEDHAAPKDKPDTTSQGEARDMAGGSGAWTDTDLSDKGQRQTEPDLSDLADRANEKAGQNTKDVMRENHGIVDFLNVTPATVRGTTKPAAPGQVPTLKAMIASPAKMRRDVTRAVRAPDLADIEHYQARGRFDRRSYTRVDAGATNVFRRMTEAPGQNAAVSMLIDLSSSMGGERINAAASLALHLGDALKAASVQFEICGFVTPAGIIQFKKFEQSWFDAQGMVGALPSFASGGTAMLPAIKAMQNRLLARKNVTRRILMVLTDGEDGYAHDSNKAAIKAGRAKGIETIGIGTLYDASPVFGRDHVYVRNLQSITTDGLGQLVAVLGRDPNARAA